MVQLADATLGSVHTSPLARILVADDFAEWRARICQMLQERTEWRIVGEASNGLQAVQKASELHPDVVFLDIGMPVMNGIEAAIQIQRVSPNSKIVFVTQEDDPDVRSAATLAGGKGFVLKANAASELLPMIAAVLRESRQPT